MKTSLILVHLLMSLPFQAADSSRTNNAQSSSELRGRASSAIPILPVPASSCMSSTFPDDERPRRGVFEPHMRRVEEDFIRQIHFKTTITRSGTNANFADTFEIEIRGYLREKIVLRQLVKVIL